MQVSRISNKNEVSAVNVNFNELAEYFATSLAGYLRQRTPAYHLKFYGKIKAMSYVIIDLKQVKFN